MKLSFASFAGPAVFCFSLLTTASGCNRMPGNDSSAQTGQETLTRKVAEARPSRPADLDGCINCHTGAMPGARKISFAADKEADFKAELLAEDKKLYLSIEERIQPTTPPPKHMPMGGQVDVKKVMDYLKGLIES